VKSEALLVIWKVVPILKLLDNLKQKNWNDVLIVLVAPILWIPTIKEFKTKPLQNAVKEMLVIQ
jgi:CTP synthase (UTP-ammonia lyase)